MRERSAEATALQLLVNLKNPHLPKASELRYLVSEQDAPQKVKTKEAIINVTAQSFVRFIGLTPENFTNKCPSELASQNKIVPVTQRAL